MIIERITKLLRFLEEYGKQTESLERCSSELFGVLDFFIYDVLGVPTYKLSGGGGTTSKNTISVSRCFIDENGKEIWITLEIEKKDNKVVPRLVIHLE